MDQIMPGGQPVRVPGVPAEASPKPLGHSCVATSFGRIMVNYTLVISMFLPLGIDQLCRINDT